MALQNRVTPWGEIVAVPERGMFTGNRGVLHDGHRTIRRRWVGRRWIVCVCEWKGRRRVVMTPGRWTELFFLDEATALAAGHRPCFFCRRGDAEAFRLAWAAGNGGGAPRAGEMDAVLHRERLEGRGKRVHAFDGAWDELPDGVMVAAGEDAFVVAAGAAWRWTAGGYQTARGARPTSLLTPLSTVRAIRAGYRPTLHSSALGG